MGIKRNLLAVSASLLISGSLTAFAGEKCTRVAGNVIMDYLKLHCIKVQGNASLKGSTVIGQFDITGQVKADNSKFTEFYVTGDVTLNKSIVSGEAIITGNIMATDTTFKAKLQATTLSLTLTSSTAEDIEIISNKPNEAAYLYLNAGSKINGNVTFKNGHGIVKNNHSTLKGKVIGGKIE